MIKSMTGYGRSEYSDERLKISVEMKSVNNRYLDLNIKMPRQLNRMESQIKEILKQYMQRGKVEYYARSGHSTPADTVITEDGETLTDSALILKKLADGTASFAPLGGIGEEHAGYKG